MNGLLHDLRFAWRMLAKNPGFSAIVIVVMGLGIGVNSSIFTVVRGILLRGLPFPEADRLMAVQCYSPREGENGFEMSGPDFIDVQQRAQSFQNIGAYYESQAYLTLNREPERFESTAMSPSLLATLGVRPLLGRAFLPEEGIDGKQYAAVIVSHRIWNDRLQADPHVIGRTFRMNGRVRTVVGVMPPRFRFPEAADFWIPFALKTEEDSRNAHFLDVMGRLAPGVSVERATAELEGIGRQLAKEYPASNQGIGIHGRSLREALTEDVRPGMIMLSLAVAFVLLIACANVANLMLARATGRSRELGIRVALGAGRFRIARQLLVESMVLGLLGGAVGVLIAFWANDLVLSAIPIELPYWMRIEVDGAVVFYSAMVAIASGILFGLAPAFQVRRRDLFESLREGSMQAGSGRGHQRLRNGLVVAEVALAMVLLVGAGLMIRSFMRMQEVKGGLDPEGVLTGQVTLPVAVYEDDERRRSFFREFIARVAEVPGVESVAGINPLPLGNSMNTSAVVPAGKENVPISERPLVTNASVTPGFFATMRIPLRGGRDFTPADGPSSPQVAIVNESAARLLWPKADAVGQKFKFDPTDSQFVTVVGVTADVRPRARSKRIAQVFRPHAQQSWQTLTLVLRTRGNPTALTAPVRQLLQVRDPDLPFYRVATMRESMRQALWEPRIYAWLMGVYSAIALIIAAVGIYGVMAYRVAQRRHEIGVRMALGAPQAVVLRMVVGQGLRLALVGLGIGLAAAFAVTRLMASLLFGVNPNDPPTFVGVVLILAGSALLACWLPAWRASRVDPMVALRHE